MARGLSLTAAAGVLTAGGVAHTSDDESAQRIFRGPVTGTPYEIHETPRGPKWLRGPDGRTYASPADVVAAEWESVPPLRRMLGDDLALLAEDEARRGERVVVTVVFRDQPCHAAGTAARERYGGELRSLQARRAEILARIAPLRSVRADGDPANLAEALSEEARLLTDAEKAELVANRDRTHALLTALRGEVMAAATPAVDAAQTAVRAFVESVPGARFHSRSVVLNALTAEVPASALLELATAFPEVGHIRRTGVARPNLDTSTTTVGAGTWWTNGYVSSSSTKVAILDTGIDASHPALSGYVSNAGTFHASGQYQSDYNDSTSSTDDLFGHGTEAGGVVGSTDSTYRGIAYGGRLMNGKGGYYDTSGWASAVNSDMRAAADWAANNGAAVVNYSWGTQGAATDGSHEMALYFDGMAFSLAVPVTISAGNSGTSSGTIGSEPSAFNVVAVGGVDDRGTSSVSDDVIYSLSSAGPTSDGRRKPDVLAPGKSVMTCAYDWEGSNPNFAPIDGTSFAAPHVAGGLALLFDYGAASYPEGFRALLMGTTRNTTPYHNVPGNLWGWGGMHLGNAYTSRGTVYEGSLTSSGSRSVFLKTGSLTAGKRVTLAWNRQVTSNGTSTPTTYYPLLDLDLYVYDAASGASLGSSYSTVDPVEQVAVSSATSQAVVEVYRYGSFSSGVSAEYWGVATESSGATTLATGPVLTCAFTSLPPAVGPATTFDVTARVTNSGDLAAASPSLTLTLPSGYSLVSGSNPQTVASLAASGGAAAATWSVRSKSSGPSGPQTIQVAASSTAFGNTFTSPTASGAHALDTDPPTGGVLVNGGAAFTSSSSVTLALNASDAYSGVALMRYREGTGTWGNWEPYAGSVPFTFSAGDGTRTAQAQYQDGVGNTSGTSSDSIVVDTVPPAGSVLLAAGAQFAGSSLVQVALSASDATSGITDMSFSDDGSAWSEWQSYATTTTRTLLAGDGPRTLHARFRDGAGNVSGTASDSVVVDTTVPSGSIAIAGGAAWTNSSVVNVALDASDALSGVSEMRLSVSGVTWDAWQPYAGTATRTLLAGEGPRTVQAQFRDGAGNVSGAALDVIQVDLTRPAGAFVLNQNEPYVLPWRPLRADVTSLEDQGGSGPADFRWSFDGGATWSAWAPLAAGLPDIAPPPDAADRTITVRGEFRDVAGNVSLASNDAVHVVAGAPQQAPRRGAMAGNFAAGGDVDAYRLDLLAGETLNVGLTAKPSIRSKTYAVSLELWGPDGRAVALPAGTKTLPVKRLAVPATGTYWLIARPSGTDTTAAAKYTLKFTTTTPKSLLKLKGTAVPAVGDAEGTVSIDLGGASGWRIAGTLKNASAGAATLTPPAGPAAQLTLPAPRRGIVKLPKTYLPAGAGTYRLTVPAAAPVLYTLTLTPPGTTNAVELP